MESFQRRTVVAHVLDLSLAKTLRFFERNSDNPRNDDVQKCQPEKRKSRKPQRQLTSTDTTRTMSSGGHVSQWSPPNSSPLNSSEQTRFAAYESRVAAAFESLLDGGQALLAIQNERLYRERYGSFEEYCRERWQMSRSYAYRLIAAAQILAQMSPMGDIPRPCSERQLRPLLKVDTETAVEVWKEAVKQAAGRPVTGSLVSKCVRAIVSLQDGPQARSSSHIVASHLREMLERDLRRVQQLLRQDKYPELLGVIERMKILIERYGDDMKATVVNNPDI